MDYKAYLKEFEEKSPSQIKNISVELGKMLLDIAEALEVPKDSLGEVIYYAGLLSSFSDNCVDDKEIKLINELNNKLNLNKDELTVASAKSMLKDYQDILECIVKMYSTFEAISDDITFKKYSNITNGLRINEVFVKFICSVISVNGVVDESEIDLIETMLNGATESKEEDEEVQDTSYELGDDYDDEPPVVKKVGGTLYNDSYNTYFSVGAEIEIKGRDINGLDIRVQLLDSSGFILESFDERVAWVERGIFHFGKEYNIDCKPSSFKIIVGAGERGDLLDDYKASCVFKCTGMRFTRNSNSYSTSYDLACMVENVRLTDCKPETEVYVTFYDENDDIVGGARLTGNVLYKNQPDRYDTRIDCISVVNKTHLFRWSCDVYFVS